MYINAEEYLQEIRKLKIRIVNLRRELRMQDEILGASAIQYSPDRVQTSPRQDGLEMQVINNLEKKQEIESRIQSDIYKMMERMDEAVSIINQMESDEQKEVLMLRYIECRSWSEILDIRGCDDIRSQYKLHSRAIENLQKLLEK